jgi:hypothetical protein
MHDKKVEAATSGQAVTDLAINRTAISYTTPQKLSTSNSPHKADLEWCLLWFGLSSTFSDYSCAMQSHSWFRFEQAAREYLDLIHPRRGNLIKSGRILMPEGDKA